MIIAKKIRDSLNTVSPGGLTLDQLTDKTGIDRKKLGSNLGSFLQRGEVEVKADKEGVNRYHLNPSYTRGGVSPGRKGKKSDGKRGKRTKRARKPNSYRTIAAKLARDPDMNGDLKHLAQENYRAAGAELREIVRDQVEGYDTNPDIMRALNHHERAEKIVDAARSA